MASESCPRILERFERYEAAGGRFPVCPICFNARHLDVGQLVDDAELSGSVPLWQWIVDESASTFSC